MKIRVRPVQIENIWRIPVWRQMQRHEDGNARGRQVFMKIDAVHVNDIEAPAFCEFMNRIAIMLINFFARLFVMTARHSWHGNENAFRDRTFTGDHNRIVTGAREGEIELRNNLFRAADSIGAGGRKRVSHIKHREIHKWNGGQWRREVQLRVETRRDRACDARLRSQVFASVRRWFPN